MALWLSQFASPGTAVGAAVAVALAAAAVVYILLQQSFRREGDELRAAFEQRLSSMEDAIRAISNKAENAQLAVAGPVAAAVAAPAQVPASAPATAAKPSVPAEEIAPEMLLVIAAAVTAFLGKKVRIRSAKMLYSPESNNAWSQQGRVFVQASHNIAQRGY
jgi:hypothetical protein